MAKPLVLPVPRTEGWLVLIGGGEFSFGETREADTFLLSLLPADNRRIAFLPTASGSTDYARHLETWLRTLDPSVSVENIPVYHARDERRRKHCDAILSAGATYIGGGVTNPLVDLLRGSPVRDALAESLAAGGVIAAIGAGAAACGRIAVDMKSASGVIEGLNLLPGGVIETNFDPALDARLRRLCLRPEAAFGIGIPSGAALAVGPRDAAEILGEGSIALVRKATPQS